MLFYMLSAAAGGLDIIILVAWAIGRALRRIMRVPRGRDFPEKPAEVF